MKIISNWQIIDTTVVNDKGNVHVHETMYFYLEL